MEIFAFLAVLIPLFIFLISIGSQIKDKVEDELENVEIFNRSETSFEKLLSYNKLDVLYDQLILFYTSNLLITGLLLLSASAYKTTLNCIPFLLIIILIYIPSVAITYLTYRYFVNVRLLKKI